MLRVHALEEITRRGGEAQLRAGEILEDHAVVAADGAVCLIADDELEIVRCEIRAVTLDYDGNVIESDTVLWQSYWLFLPIVLLLTLEWIIRKRSGML